MNHLFHKVKEEFFLFLPPAIFFFISLHAVALVHVLMLKGTGISAESSMSILMAALILGKAVLLADALPIINQFPDKPLIYNVTWKTLIYLLLATLMHYLERLYEFSRQAGGIADGNRKMMQEIIWPHFFAMEIILLLLILMYCTMHELIRVIGKDKVKQIFLGPIDSPDDFRVRSER